MTRLERSCVVQYQRCYLCFQDAAVLTLLTPSMHIDLSGYTHDVDFAERGGTSTKSNNGISDHVDGSTQVVSGWRHAALSELFPVAVSAPHSTFCSDGPQQAYEGPGAAEDVCCRNIVGGLLLNQGKSAGFAAQAVGNTFCNQDSRPGNANGTTGMLGADFVSALSNFLTPLSSPDSRCARTGPKHKVR